MTDNYFEENNKFLSLKGILNRRNFIVNFCILEIIASLIFTTPMIYLLFTNPNMMADFSQSAVKSNVFPLWFTIWLGVSGLIECGLFFPSIVRRVRDIIGEVDENRVYLVSSVLAVFMLLGYTPANAVSPFFKWISIFVILVLMFTKGKISADKPKSEIAKFNWGACFGTWLWGLFNKTPITLVMLPLLLTTGWFAFMIICGLKGNEWAYKNNEKYDNVEKFHHSQSNQSALWVVITPILAVIAAVVLFIASGMFMYNYTKSNPQALTKMEEKAKAYQEVAVKSNFSKIELTDDEYKFYMDPQIWVKLPENSKRANFDVAAGYVVSKKYPDIKSKEAKQGALDIRNKTKIYSTFNNELLAEYNINTQEMKDLLEKISQGEKGAFKKYMQYYTNCYKLNTHPTLP